MSLNYLPVNSFNGHYCMVFYQCQRHMLLCVLGCLYKGMVFQKGQKFDDGCDYECECLDDNTGKYRCVEK